MQGVRALYPRCSLADLNLHTGLNPFSRSLFLSLALFFRPPSHFLSHFLSAHLAFAYTKFPGHQTCKRAFSAERGQ
ncbi:hypothetical protein PUN28_018316 [Cardiocondyla obscurior]|uniref:Uncharacterized protein n=1 Tax=Cardiocondyla obscurior TaxID=286306 RepID=A0AAW2EKL4_9HYME